MPQIAIEPSPRGVDDSEYSFTLSRNSLTSPEATLMIQALDRNSSSTTTRHWLFQTNPKQSAFLEDLKTREPGDAGTWTVSSKHKEMEAGDKVVFWISGRTGGICALGELTGKPYPRDREPTEDELKKSPFLKSKWLVDYRYTNILKEPISRDAAKADPVLRDLAVLKFSNATNFRVTQNEWDVIDSMTENKPQLKPGFEEILSRYVRSRFEPFGREHPVWEVFENLSNRLIEYTASRPNLKVKWSVGQGTWARVPWIAFLDSRETNSTQRGVYPVFLFREDMKGLYLTLNQGIAKLREKHGTPESRRMLRDRSRQLRQYTGELGASGFLIDEGIDLHTGRGLEKDYEACTVAYKQYHNGSIPGDAELLHDLEQVLVAYDRYLEDRPFRDVEPPGTRVMAMPAMSDFDSNVAIQEVISYIQNRGFIFEPWQIAQYITAVRTKPFVILAGITGTGKSKLPALVAEATGGESRLVPVRPDWTDSADVLGYTDLQGDFHPGALLEMAHDASTNSDRFWTCITDEMNLARVEQYFAEVLSRIEDRYRQPDGGYTTKALIGQVLKEEDSEWSDVVIPSNLAIVGTVNMDESAHGFSRKVLDRAFTIELSDVDLALWNQNAETISSGRTVSTWPVSSWHPRAIMLADLANVSEVERSEIDRSIGALQTVNEQLASAQLQVGYRTRDEVALYLLHAREILEAFVGRDGINVDPLDLALQMKILPRIVGGSAAIRRCVLGLLGWATTGIPLKSDEDARSIFESWEDSGRPSSIQDGKFPRFAARLCLMWERLETEGYTSYWV